MDTKPATPSDAKLFTLGQVLSASTGRLLCPIGGVYEILNHITGDNLFTHALPRAFKFASPLLKAHFPELEIAESEENQGRLNAALEGLSAPEKLAACNVWVKALPLPQTLDVPSWASDWEEKEPLAELAEEIGEDRVKARCAVVEVRKP
jgi:hypothetical protein